MPPPVPTQAAVRVVKTFPYRGGTKQWANKYYLNSTVGPADSSHWHTLMDNIVAAEKLIYSPAVQIIECVAYEGGSALPIDSKTYTQNGTYSDSFAIGTPGDCAGMIRYTTTQRTSKNHPIYLYSWHHDVAYRASTGVDTVIASLVSAYNTYGAAWCSGFSDGTATFKKAGPFGAVAQSASASTKIRHRDFLN